MTLDSIRNSCDVFQNLIEKLGQLASITCVSLHTQTVQAETTFTFVMFYIAPMMTQKNSGLTHLKAVSQPGCRLLRDYSRQQRKVLLAMLWGLRPEKPGNSLCKSPHHLQYIPLDRLL